MAHEEFFQGSDAIACLKELLSRPPADWPKRLILSVSHGDVQLYVKVRRADELAAPEPESDA